MGLVALLPAAALLWAATGASGEAPPSPPQEVPASSRLAVTTFTPADGSTVSGPITWQVNVLGGIPGRVDFAIDRSVMSTQTRSPYLYAGTLGGLDTTTLTNGSHTLTATAYPIRGGPAKSSVTVTVSNQTAAVAPTWSLPPAVSGSAQVGQTLTTSTGSWAGTAPISYAYQWLRCGLNGGNCAAIPGATGKTYVVATADVGSTLRSRVTASNVAGSASAQSAQTAAVVSATVRSTSIYWGAVMDGKDTYTYLYGGSWGNAPWDVNTWSRFESNAGKRVSIVHWSVGKPWDHSFTYWQNTFESVRARGELSLVSMNSGSVALRTIASGAYDSYLRTWAQQAAAYGHPFFVRWDWEMNGNWWSWGTTTSNQNTPADYVAAWRHIHDVFTRAGALNVTRVWCVNWEFTGEVPLEQLYPGDGYVDWTALDGYNTGRQWWMSFSTLFGPTYNHLLKLAPTKPIMVAEIASIETGGSKAGWITDMFSTQLPQSYPKIKAVVWLNWRFYEGGSWWDYEIESSSSAQAA